MGDDLAARIASFPRWHYEFDLRGNRTPVFDPAHVNRHRQRREHVFAALLAHQGGDLRGARVLDLGCNAGFWSLEAIRAGCEFVLGVDARAMHVEQAELVFATLEVESGRYRFLQDDALGFDPAAWPRFDVALCLGLLYHVAEPVRLMEVISRSGAGTVVIDTSLSTLPGSVFEVRHERLDDPRNAVSRELVLYPSAEAVSDLASAFGYHTVALEPRMEDWEGCEDYRAGLRRAFLCTRAAVR